MDENTTERWLNIHIDNGQRPFIHVTIKTDQEEFKGTFGNNSKKVIESMINNAIDAFYENAGVHKDIYGEWAPQKRYSIGRTTS